MKNKHFAKRQKKRVQTHYELTQKGKENREKHGHKFEY